ncbi:MAG: hypothetical protein GY792_25405 [Gammaproteobacteria bacterium]|nr:hypothetical protein [Gammaproteobacteria bacterium]
MIKQAIAVLHFGAESLLQTNPHPLRSSLHRSLAGVWLACGSLTLFTPTPASAWVVDMQSTVNIGGNLSYANPFEILSLPIIDVSPSIGIDLGLIGGGASGHADVEARVVIDGNSAFNLASKANARSFMFTVAPQPTVGESFHLINQIDSLGIQKLNVKSDGFQAFAGLHADIGGSAWGKACLGFCAKASIGLKVKGVLPLASIDKSGLNVFGSSVDKSSPYTFSGLGGLAKASANIPTFAKTFTNLQPGQAAVMAPKQESALYANLDVAGLVAKAAGFPLPLKGDLLGFGYELLSLDAFAGVDVEHAFSLKPLPLKTIYQFSSPVEFFDKSTNTWSNPVDKLTMGDNQSIELRSTDATSIGVSRQYELSYKLDYDFDLLLNAGVDLSALELHGLGLSLGPLIDPDPWKISLGRFDIDSGSKIGKIRSQGEISNILFNPQKLITGTDGVSVLVDTCALLPDGCEQTGYVTDRIDMGDYIQETTYRVVNLGSIGCDGVLVHDCIIDPDFPALVKQVRNRPVDLPSRTDDLLALLDELGLSDLFPDLNGPADMMEYADDFEQLGAFLAATPLIEGEVSSPELMRDTLWSIGIDPYEPFPPREPLTGAPPLKEGDLTEDRSASLQFIVPEPSMFSLLALAGLAFVAVLRSPSMRRRV